MSSVGDRVDRQATRARAAEDTHGVRVAAAHAQILARHGRMPNRSCMHDAIRWPCPDVISIAAAYGIRPDEIEP